MAREGLGFEITELRLGLPGGEPPSVVKNEKKRMFSEINGEGDENECSGDRKIDKKNQVVGWPPVCSYRKKNTMNEGSKMYMKVSMDGAPFLRKIDLGMHKGYLELALALEKLFDCCGIGECYIFHVYLFLLLLFYIQINLSYYLWHDFFMLAIG